MGVKGDVAGQPDPIGRGFPFSGRVFKGDAGGVERSFGSGPYNGRVQTAVRVGDLDAVGAGDYHLVAAVQGRADIPALEIPVAVTRHNGGAGQRGRADAVQIPGIRIISGMGAGRAGIPADPFDRLEDRVQMGGFRGPQLPVGRSDLCDRIAVVVQSRTGHLDGCFGPADKDHGGVVHFIRVLIRDAVLRHVHIPVAFAVQVDPPRKDHGVGIAGGVVLVVEDHIDIAREFRVQIDGIILVEIGDGAEGIRNRSRGTVGRIGAAKIPAGEGGLLVLGVDGALRRDRGFAFPDDLHVSLAFFRADVGVQIIRHIVQILVKGVEIVGAHMDRAGHGVHREAVRGEADGLSVDGAVHVADREAVLPVVLDKVEHVHGGVIAQRLAEQADADLHVPVGLVNASAVGLVDDLDIKYS